VADPGERMAELVSDAVRRMQAGLALVTSASFVEVAGVDRDHLLDQLRDRLAVPAVYVYAPDFCGDLFAGYSRALAALAEHYARPGPGGPGAAGRVNLLGYLLDRPWREHAANLAEARRLIEAAGLTLNVTMLDGSAAGELEALPRAESNVVVPGGLDAARLLERACGQRPVEVGVPMGLGGTRAFLERLAEVAGSRAQVRTFATREEDRVRTLVRQACEPLTGRRVALFSDGAKLQGLLWLCQDLRLTPVLAGVLDGRAALVDRSPHPRLELLDDPSHREIDEHLRRAARAGEIDLVVGTAHQVQTARSAGLAAVEFGFPCRDFQALAPTPYWGYEGVLTMGMRLLEAAAAVAGHGD